NRLRMRGPGCGAFGAWRRRGPGSPDSGSLCVRGAGPDVAVLFDMWRAGDCRGRHHRSLNEPGSITGAGMSRGTDMNTDRKAARNIVESSQRLARAPRQGIILSIVGDQVAFQVVDGRLRHETHAFELSP